MFIIINRVSQVLLIIKSNFTSLSPFTLKYIDISIAFYILQLYNFYSSPHFDHSLTIPAVLKKTPIYNLENWKGDLLGLAKVLFSTLVHLPPVRFQCVGGCWDWTQDFCIQTIVRHSNFENYLDFLASALVFIMVLFHTKKNKKPSKIYIKYYKYSSYAYVNLHLDICKYIFSVRIRLNELEWCYINWFHWPFKSSGFIKK